mmetsp:Transcript_9899/g.19434  ORF Transcript_9899/g.19434 Transcript_9899/m.19434 type:complete len:424 (-) Transcript_9899:193-1464(-)
MGNTNKSFQGEGHSLRDSNGPPPASQARAPSTKTGKTGRSGLGFGKTKASAPKAKSTEELAAQRARQEEAAARRNREWDERLNRQRQKRAQENQQMRDSSTLADGESVGGGTAANSEKESLKDLDKDGKISAQYEKHARALEQSGFNPYESSSHSAAAGRAAINLVGMEAPEDGVQHVTSSSSSSSAASDRARVPHTQADEQAAAIVEMMQQLSVDLDNAAEMANLSKLNSAIEAANRAVSSGVIDSEDVDPELMHKYEAAVTLRDALLASTDNASGDNDISPLEPAPIASMSSSEEAVLSLTDAMGELESAAVLDRTGSLKTLKNLIKVMDNVKNNPDEMKFRKLRLNNPAIKNMFVTFASGAPVRVLETLGFMQMPDDSENAEASEQVLVLDSVNENIFATRYDGTRAVLSKLLHQLDAAI